MSYPRAGCHFFRVGSAPPRHGTKSLESLVRALITTGNDHQVLTAWRSHITSLQPFARYSSKLPRALEHGLGGHCSHGFSFNSSASAQNAPPFWPLLHLVSRSAPSEHADQRGIPRSCQGVASRCGLCTTMVGLSIRGSANKTGPPSFAFSCELQRGRTALACPAATLKARWWLKI